MPRRLGCAAGAGGSAVPVALPWQACSAAVSVTFPSLPCRRCPAGCDLAPAAEARLEAIDSSDCEVTFFQTFTARSPVAVLDVEGKLMRPK